MAELRAEGDQLVLALTSREHIYSLSRDLSAPLSAVRRVWVPAIPWLVLRGWRSAGVAVPGKVALGSRRHGDGWDFTAIHRGEEAVVVELVGQRYAQWLVGVADAGGTGAAVSAAAGVAFDPTPVTYEPR